MTARQYHLSFLILNPPRRRQERSALPRSVQEWDRAWIRRWEMSRTPSQANSGYPIGDLWRTPQSIVCLAGETMGRGEVMGDIAGLICIYLLIPAA